DDAGAMRVAAGLTTAVWRVGLAADADVRIATPELGERGSAARIELPGGGEAVRLGLQVPGLHNLRNAAAALAVALELAGARERRRRGGRADLRGARAAAPGRHRGFGGAGGGARRSGDGGGAGPRGTGRLGGGTRAAGGCGLHAWGGGRHSGGARAAAPAGGSRERGATAVSRRRTWARRSAPLITGMAVGGAVWFR